MQEGCLNRRLGSTIHREKRLCSVLRKGSSRRDFEAAADGNILGYREDGARCFSEVHSGKMRSIR